MPYEPPHRPFVCCVKALHVLTNRNCAYEKKSTTKLKQIFVYIALTSFFPFKHTLPVQQACGELQAYNPNCVYLIHLFFLCTLPQLFALYPREKRYIPLCITYVMNSLQLYKLMIKKRLKFALCNWEKNSKVESA